MPFYFSSRKCAVEGLSAYILNTTIVSGFGNFSHEERGTPASECYVGIEVAFLFPNGSQTLRTINSYVNVSRASDGCGFQNASWACPDTSVPIDTRIVLSIYEQVGSAGWVFKDKWITSKLKEVSFGGKWVFQLWTKRAVDAIRQSTRIDFCFGNSTYNSLVDNMAFSNFGKLLPVIHYDEAVKANWIASGASPYINPVCPDSFDLTASFVSSIGRGSIGWFYFGNTAHTPKQVYLEVLATSSKDNSSDNLSLEVWNGNEIREYNITDLDYAKRTWRCMNVTSFLNTKQKINDCRLMIESTAVGIYATTVTAIRLRIVVGPHLIAYGQTSRQQGQTSTIYTKWYDNTTMRAFAFNHNSSGSCLTTNITGTLSGSTTWVNLTITLNPQSSQCVAYKVWVQNTLGRWENTDILTFPVIKTTETYLADHMKTLGNASTWACHPPSRRNFYGINSKRWYMFWADANKNFVYSHSMDGISWSAPVYIRSAQSGMWLSGGFYYENRGCVDYVHCLYGEFSQVNRPIIYRRGALTTNGSIVWSAGEQLIVSATPVIEAKPDYLDITPQGHVYISYTTTSGTTGLGQAFVTFCNKTDGTWSTYPGYPKNVTCSWKGNGTECVFTAVNHIGTDDAYVVVAARLPVHIIQGRAITNHVVGPIENITAYPQQSVYYFTTVSDGSRVYLSYRSANDTNLRYCYRNNAGSWQIKDEVVTSHVTPPPKGDNGHDSWTFPSIAYDRENSLIFENWATREDNSLWVSTLTASTWSQRERFAVLNDEYVLDMNPNALVPYSHDGMLLFSCEIQRISDGTHKIVSILYEPMAPDRSLTSSGGCAMRPPVPLFIAAVPFAHDWAHMLIIPLSFIKGTLLAVIDYKTRPLRLPKR